MLRANDLIWSFVINNYLLGKQPMPFDLLYWNSDTTRMPEKLHLSYLRQCYKENALARGKMEMAGVKLDLSQGQGAGLSAVGARRTTSPRPIRSSSRCNLFGGPVRFIIAGSGHIAGVINPPAAKKYQYWTNDSFAKEGGAKDIEAWQQRLDRASRLLVAGLGQMAVQTVRRESARAPARRRRAQTAGRCAGDLCEGQGAVGRRFAHRR